MRNQSDEGEEVIHVPTKKRRKHVEKGIFSYAC